MGRLLQWFGAGWAVFGVAVIVLSLIRGVPQIRDLLLATMAASPQAGSMLDPSAIYLFVAALTIITGISFYVIPGMLVAGVGKLIRLQQEGRPT